MQLLPRSLKYIVPQKDEGKEETRPVLEHKAKERESAMWRPMLVYTAVQRLDRTSPYTDRKGTSGRIGTDSNGGQSTQLSARRQIGTTVLGQM